MCCAWSSGAINIAASAPGGAPEPRNILLCALLPIGDTLFLTPALRAVRRHYPRARITALTYPTNRGILRANPDVDRLWLAPTRQAVRTPDRFLTLAYAIRRGHFDLALEFSNYNYGL